MFIATRSAPELGIEAGDRFTISGDGRARQEREWPDAALIQELRDEGLLRPAPALPAPAPR
jgi:hypothetical protein